MAKIEEFYSGDKIYRSRINDKLLQMERMFVVPIENGGTGATTIDGAMQNLSLELKVVLYNNASGTGGSIEISSTQYGEPRRIEIYYGYGNIRGHCEYKSYHYTDGYSDFDLSLNYLTSSDNLVVRHKKYHYYYTYNNIIEFVPLNDDTNPSKFFAADGTTWTSTEDIKIYKIIGYF